MPRKASKMVRSSLSALGRVPAVVDCPGCDEQVLTQTDFEIGTSALYVSVLLQQHPARLLSRARSGDDKMLMVYAGTKGVLPSVFFSSPAASLGCPSA